MFDKRWENNSVGVASENKKKPSSQTYCVYSQHTFTSVVQSKIKFVSEAHVYALNIFSPIEFTSEALRERGKPPANKLQIRGSVQQHWLNIIECLHLYASLSFIRQAHLVSLESLECPKGLPCIIWGKQLPRAHGQRCVSPELGWRQRRGNWTNESMRQQELSAGGAFSALFLTLLRGLVKSTAPCDCLKCMSFNKQRLIKCKVLCWTFYSAIVGHKKGYNAVLTRHFIPQKQIDVLWGSYSLPSMPFTLMTRRSIH